MSCYCGSAQNFAFCCLPFIEGKQKPTTAEQLMRSRYSAYCVAHVDYIQHSYHPDKQAENPPADIAAFAKSAHFIALTIMPAPTLQHATVKNAQLLQSTEPLVAKTLSSMQRGLETTSGLADGSVDYVHFIARFIQHDKLQQLEEISRFVWQQQQWWYVDGQLLPQPVCKINRNDSCPCGSGKKYKLCKTHLASGQTPPNSPSK